MNQGGLLYSLEIERYQETCTFSSMVRFHTCFIAPVLHVVEELQVYTHMRNLLRK
jgi:hypothetical protein